MALSPLWERAKIKLPKVYDPVDLFLKNKLNKKDLDNFRKEFVKQLDAAMQGSNKGIYCLRNSDVNRSLRTYDILVLTNILKDATKSEHNTFGIAQDENEDDDSLLGKVIIDFPDSQVIVYKKNLEDVGKKLKKQWMYGFLDVVEHLIIHVILHYYGNNKYKGKEYEKIYETLLGNIFGTKLDKKILKKFSIEIIKEKKIKQVISPPVREKKEDKKSAGRPIKKSAHTKKASPKKKTSAK